MLKQQKSSRPITFLVSLLRLRIYGEGGALPAPEKMIHLQDDKRYFCREPLGHLDDGNRKEDRKPRLARSIGKFNLVALDAVAPFGVRHKFVGSLVRTHARENLLKGHICSN